jgi:formate hydrogenlyase transcriptional activator
VNCGAISAGLVESELFGHVKGAFTGALQRRVGRFELADGGTLFLDEVGELPMDTQVKLLRVLQEQEFEPVGSSETRRVDVRVVAATNRNLEDAVREGRFRADLFYRLNVIPLRVPPLRERREDIPQIAAFFLDRCARKAGRSITGIAPSTLQRLVQYHWPGNVRELQNVIERGVVLSNGPMLQLDEHVLPLPSSRVTRTAGNAGAADASVSPALAVPTAMEEIERSHVLGVLERCGWVIEGPEGAARLLNLNPSTLRSRLRKLGIARQPVR